MCKYCDTEIESEDRPDLISKVINAGNFGNGEVDVQIMQETKSGTEYLYLWFSTKYGQLENEHIKINYCPICGRKLNES